MARFASAPEMGGSRKARSSHTSVATPPEATITNGPIDGSRTSPRATSVPATMGCTSTSGA